MRQPEILALTLHTSQGVELLHAMNFVNQASRSYPTRRIDAREAVSLPATRSCASPGAGHAGGNEHAEASGAGEVREAKSIHRIHLTF